MFPVISGNGQRVNYHRIVKFKNNNNNTTASDRWNAFRHSLPTAQLRSILETMAPLEQSVEIFAHRLYSIDPAAVARGIIAAGGSAPLVTLTPEQTIMVRNKANVSSVAMIMINRCVRAFQNNKQSIFSSYKQCAEIESKAVTILNFSTYTATVKDPKRHGDMTKINLPFTHASPFVALREHLIALMNGIEMTTDPSLGISLGEAGCVLPVIIMGDAGGGVFSCIAEFRSFEGAGQRYNTNIGEFTGKESYDVVKNTVIPSIFAGINEMHNNIQLEDMTDLARKIEPDLPDISAKRAELNLAREKSKSAENNLER